MSGSACARCGTELAPSGLACPACGALRYSDRLKEVAAAAESARQAGDAGAAREHWASTLALLPADSQQYAIVQQKIAQLTDANNTAESAAQPSERSWLRRGIGAIATTAVLLTGKLKFLLLGLTKAGTFISMFAFFSVYWSIYGWPLALGLVVSIYIHEMGHVSMLRRFGIAAGAPLFIPGVGAVVMLRQHVLDPITDARIGLAGPIWGLGAGLAAAAVYAATGAHIWLAIARLTGFINLFNLIPVWQLDGSRGFHALSQSQRWIAVAVLVVALFATEQRLLLLVVGAAVWRAMQREAGPGDTRTLTLFGALVLALSALARGIR
ncbi:MAG TPA: site-2 protease family protein [Vicinamibacterales bacterium]